MTLSDDLLEQASHLAKRDKRKPKQASLRRAVSALYYSLFHRVVADDSRRLVSVSRFHAVVGRSFEHKELLKAASVMEGLSKPNQQHWLKEHLSTPVSSELASFCQTFVELQGRRHDADYDVTAKFTRSEVIGLLTRTRAAHAAWTKERDTDNALVFLLFGAKLIRGR